MTPPYHWFSASLPHGDIPSELYPNLSAFIAPNSNIHRLWKGADWLFSPTQTPLKCRVNRRAKKNAQKTHISFGQKQGVRSKTFNASCELICLKFSGEEALLLSICFQRAAIMGATILCIKSFCK